VNEIGKIGSVRSMTLGPDTSLFTAAKSEP